jgi:hypothetical protein
VSDTSNRNDNVCDDKISDNSGLQLDPTQIPDSLVPVLKLDRKDMADSYVIVMVELSGIYK